MKKLLLIVTCVLFGLAIGPAMAESDAQATNNIAWILSTLDPFADHCDGGVELTRGIPVESLQGMRDWANDHQDKIKDASIRTHKWILLNKSQWCAEVRPFVMKLVHNMQIQNFNALPCHKTSENVRCYY